MRKNYISEIDELLRLKKYDESYDLIKNEINACLKLNKDIRLNISEISDYERKRLIYDEIKIYDAYVYQYQLKMEQTLYYQLKKLVANIEEFIKKLNELKPFLLDQPEHNDYWLFWHLPTVIKTVIDTILDDNNLYKLFNAIKPLPFLRNHESYLSMIKSFLKATNNEKFKKEIQIWSGIDINIL